MSLRRSTVSVLIPVVGALALALALLGVSPTNAQIVINPDRSYPSTSCPKASGLQACIDGLDAGAGIRLTEVGLDEDVLIRKSLTLASSPSIRARLRHIRLEDSAGPSDIDVKLRGLEVTDGIDSSFTDGSLDHVTISGSRIATSTKPEAILMSSSVPIAVDLERNTILDTVTIGSTLTTGTSSLRAAGNTMRPGFSEAAFQTVQLDAGTIVANIHNNVIRDASVAIQVTSREAASRLQIDIVGNTVDDVGDVVAPSPTTPIAGAISLDVFDNIFTNVTGTAFSVPSESAFRAGHNDYFRVGRRFPPGSDLSAGSGNLREDPKYVNRATGNLRLRASSPLIDRGIACHQGGLEAVDADGHFRWAGKDVDMGAFERGAGVPSGSVFLGGSGRNTFTGTSGRDVLCGFGGNDGLNGGSGPDYIDGGPGNDTLAGGPAGDRIIGGSGRDTLKGGSSGDVLCARDGVRGNDTADGGSGADRGALDTSDKRRSLEKIGGC